MNFCLNKEINKETVDKINEHLAIHWTNSDCVVKFNNIPQEIEPLGYDKHKMTLHGLFMDSKEGHAGYWWYVSSEGYPDEEQEIIRRKEGGFWGKDYRPPLAEVPEKYKNTIWDRNRKEKSIAERQLELAFFKQRVIYHESC